MDSFHFFNPRTLNRKKKKKKQSIPRNGPEAEKAVHRVMHNYKKALTHSPSSKVSLSSMHMTTSNNNSQDCNFLSEHSNSNSLWSHFDPTQDTSKYLSFQTLVDDDVLSGRALIPVVCPCPRSASDCHWSPDATRNGFDQALEEIRRRAPWLDGRRDETCSHAPPTSKPNPKTSPDGSPSAARVNIIRPMVEECSATARNLARQLCSETADNSRNVKDGTAFNCPLQDGLPESVLVTPSVEIYETTAQIVPTKRAASDTTPKPPSSPRRVSPEDDGTATGEWLVDEILDLRVQKDQKGVFYLEYKVGWHGDSPSWEPRKNMISGCDKLVHEFHTRQPRKPTCTTLARFKRKDARKCNRNKI
ncbi:hypothetical protein DIZ76_010106 [Coccidioides immitis]|nr:hypothetical protein DIZ76_010106 [Coccidioides immitis]